MDFLFMICGADKHGFHFVGLFKYESEVDLTVIS